LKDAREHKGKLEDQLRQTLEEVAHLTGHLHSLRARDTASLRLELEESRDVLEGLRKQLGDAREQEGEAGDRLQGAEARARDLEARLAAEQANRGGVERQAAEAAEKVLSLEKEVSWLSLREAGGGGSYIGDGQTA
jgi:chromosome segregation ATPase